MHRVQQILAGLGAEGRAGDRHHRVGVAVARRPGIEDLVDTLQLRGRRGLRHVGLVVDGEGPRRRLPQAVQAAAGRVELFLRLDLLAVEPEDEALAEAGMVAAHRHGEDQVGGVLAGVERGAGRAAAFGEDIWT